MFFLDFEFWLKIPILKNKIFSKNWNFETDAVFIEPTGIAKFASLTYLWKWWV